jgi:hypothetical protein
VAGTLGVKAPIAIRVNPDVDAHTHAKITTGKSGNKFGIPLVNAAAAYEAAAKNGREADLQKELAALFATQNTSGSGNRTSIPATYLRVTVTKP